jgi:hypothetical protein
MVRALTKGFPLNLNGKGGKVCEGCASHLHRNVYIHTYVNITYVCMHEETCISRLSIHTNICSKCITRGWQ